MYVHSTRRIRNLTQLSSSLSPSPSTSPSSFYLSLPFSLPKFIHSLNRINFRSNFFSASMRIRGRNLSPAAAEADRHISVSSPQSQSPSPSSSPSSSSSSSSITAAHSSLASSQDSSTSFPFSLLDTTTHRCRGLDLLVKAIHQVTAGSVIGVPYIQRRVTIRRRRRITPGFPFHGVVLTEMFGQSKAQQQNGKKLKNKQRKGKNSARQRTAIGFSF